MPFAAVHESAIGTSRHFAAPQNLSAIGATADNGGFWLAIVCPLLTHKRHWPCAAAMVLMPVLASIKVLV
jgi:hypothetical protein